MLSFYSGADSLEAKTLFAELQRTYPGCFADGQLRTLQGRIKQWRATDGPSREVYFLQRHEPGRLCASDFTHLTELGITIAGQSFPHLAYHSVLTYSNWETVTVCYAENFESLAEGLQNALWEFGAVPAPHRTDSLSSAVNNMSDPKEFTARYAALLRYYGLEPEKTQPGRANENGDVEQRHHRFKRAVDQALLLRGSREFAAVAAYQQFLKDLLAQLNAGRRWTARRGDGGQGAAAGEAHGAGQAGTRAGRLGEPDLCGPKRLFGVEPADRRAGGGTRVPGSGGGLVRPAEGGRVAAAAWPGQAPELFRELATARADGSHAKLLERLGRIDLLIVDDWAMAPLAEAERRDFLEICDARYQAHSTLLTSQLPVASWHAQIGDPTVADSILDRLVHNVHRLDLKGESMRKRRNGKSGGENA